MDKSRGGAEQLNGRREVERLEYALISDYEHDVKGLNIKLKVLSIM